MRIADRSRQGLRARAAPHNGRDRSGAGSGAIGRGIGLVRVSAISSSVQGFRCLSEPRGGASARAVVRLVADVADVADCRVVFTYI